MSIHYKNEYILCTINRVTDSFWILRNQYDNVHIKALFLHLYDNFRSVLEQASLTQSIALDIIFYRNIVISKSWHYTGSYKTDKSIIRKNNSFWICNMVLENIDKTYEKY